MNLSVRRARRSSQERAIAPPARRSIVLLRVRVECPDPEPPARQGALRPLGHSPASGGQLRLWSRAGNSQLRPANLRAPLQQLSSVPAKVRAVGVSSTRRPACMARRSWVVGRGSWGSLAWLLEAAGAVALERCGAILVPLRLPQPHPSS
jgi:hypothetical protein